MRPATPTELLTKRGSSARNGRQSTADDVQIVFLGIAGRLHPLNPHISPARRRGYNPEPSATRRSPGRPPVYKLEPVFLVLEEVPREIPK